MDSLVMILGIIAAIIMWIVIPAIVIWATWDMPHGFDGKQRRENTHEYYQWDEVDDDEG